ncbi:hypothetical protein NDU88_008667 [Pleurodeles waltl]|uniref:Uncharacterized protein n=1 Tax=Pleurodeles waltl TaxID=8319 RepID=A0AAV7PSV4_PLEWA|nr:hypothetical protein NDU88_008667 [Pleurodeles waltl]
MLTTTRWISAANDMRVCVEDRGTERRTYRPSGGVCGLEEPIELLQKERIELNEWGIIRHRSWLIVDV